MKETARKGAIARNAKYGNPTQNPKTAKKAKDTWRKKHLKTHIKRVRKEMLNGKASMMGKLSNKYENEVAEKIKNEYDSFFRPASICDRIGIKDGKLIFIEIKQKGQKLRPKQEQFKKICEKLGIEYRIEY